MKQEQRAELCKLLAEGQSLRKAAEAVGSSAQSALRLVESDATFAEQYAQARVQGYHLLADEIVSISDEQDVQAHYNGEEVKLDLSATAVARNRLRVDTRKWMLSKMLPKVYGDKLGVELSGTVKVQRITRTIIDPPTRAE